jgi:hypothetical protein
LNSKFDFVRGLDTLGNARSNAKYEARLPENYKRPSHARDGQAAVQRFIYAKYVQKKWFKEVAEEPAQQSEDNSATAHKKQLQMPSSVSENQARSEPENTGGADLLGNLLLSETPNVMDGELNSSSSSLIASNNNSGAAATTGGLVSQRSIMDELQGLSLVASGPNVNVNASENGKSVAVAGSATNQGDDIWGEGTPFVQAAQEPETSGGINQTSNNASSSFGITGASIPSAEIARRKSSKDDIMSLYDSSGMGFDTSFGAQAPPPLQPQMQQQQQQGYQYGSYQYGTSLDQTNTGGMNSTNTRDRGNMRGSTNTGSNNSYFTF